MTQILAEILLSTLVAINAALLIFIAGVLRKVMNDMDEPTFKHFVGSLVRHSSKSPFMITTLNIPAIAAIPYFYFYGFGNRWIAAGLALWLIGGLASKAIKVPIYKSVADLQSNDVVRLEKLRTRLNAGNIFQAILNCVAASLMMITFIR
jgi:hypothetical protein